MVAGFVRRKGEAVTGHFVPAADFICALPDADGQWRPDPAGPVPLPASCRMGDSDYPGAVAQLGPDWRLVVSMDGKRYALQQRLRDDAGGGWVAAGGKSPTTPARIVAKYNAAVPGLASIFAALPDDPALAVPGFLARRHAQQAMFAARDVSRAGYVRTVAHDGQLRLAVDADGLAYLVQWVPREWAESPHAIWKTLARVPSLSDVRVFLIGNVFQPTGSGMAGRISGADLLPRWDAFLDGLPELVTDGKWLSVPPVPG